MIEGNNNGHLKITLLGTGTSQGVPVLGCTCKVCQSKNPRDNRLRTSALVESATTCILIDCGPDFRQQMLRRKFSRLDGVLVTHVHYDHVAGMDDLRPFCYKYGDVDIYGDKTVVETLPVTMPYCFPADIENLYPGVPKLNLHRIEAHQMLHIGDIDVMPIRVIHDRMPILGYRFGKLAYITDMKSIPETEYEYLDGVEVLVVNALRFEKPHHSHQLVADAIEFSRRIGARHTSLIHVTHDIGFHDEANSKLPEGFEFGFDGEEIII